MSFPDIVLPSLPPNTIVPEDDNLFLPYLNRLYEDIAFTVNNKDNNFFPIPITSTPQNIPNLPNFGAYILCVSGEDADRNSSGAIIGWLPTITASLCKSSASASGQVVQLGFQAGTGSWNTFVLTINATATNFQISHNNTGVTGNFNIRILGTQ